MKKNLFTLLLILAAGMLTSSACWAKVKPMKLRVLYLGGQVDWTHGEMGSNDHFKSQAEFEQEVAKRTASFGDLLRTYFTTVKTISAHVQKLDWDGYDVVFDVKIMEGYHIYKTVADSDPYIPLKITFSLPEGAVLGDAIYPMPKPFVKDGTTIYDSNITIRQNVKLASLPASIKCTFECQCCDANVCMPPFEKEFTLKVE